MTDIEAWQEATEDARRTLGQHLNTIDEQNRHAFNILRLNAVIVTALAAVIYRFSLSEIEFWLVVIGGFGVGVASLMCFRLLHSGPVSIGVPPLIYEDLNRFDVTSDQYYSHVTGVIYPSAIRDARGQSDNYSERLNWIIIITAISIGVLGIGALYGYFLL